MTVSHPRPRSRLWLWIVLGGVLLLGGCGGGEAARVDPADLAERFLPTTRTADYPPDSLRAISVRETDDGPQIELSRNYASLHRDWSSAYLNVGTGRSRARDRRSYATFWSRELSLAELQVEMGVSSLSAARARDFIQQREQEYRKGLQFDVYWFESEGNSLLTGPGAQVVLKIDDDTYRPTTEEHGPLREAFLLSTDASGLYRKNIFVFPRTVDGTDVLSGATSMTLIVRRVERTGGRIQFAWKWPPAD